MTSRLFDGRPLDITLHVLRYLNPRDVIILRRVNRAHYSLFTSEVICRTALRIFFGEPWHSSSRPDEANVQAEGCTPQTRLLFDQVCRRRDNQRRGNFTRFYKLEPPFKSHSRAQCFGTDALGNAVLLIGSKQRSVAEQWGSFMVYWLEGDDTQRETVLHVYVDFENKLVRVLAERITITQPQNASQSAQSQGERNACNLEHLSTDMTATPTDVLIARHGKIAVCASQHYIKPTILAVLDLAELRNRSVPSSAENLDSFPLQYVWEPQELFLKGLGHRSVKLESYVPPIWQLDSAHMQPLDVNAHYVVYKNLGWFQSPDPSSRDLLASEQVVVLPLLDSIATLQQAQIHNLGPWGSHVQQLPGVSWTKTSKVPRGSALTAVGTDHEGKLIFYGVLNPQGMHINVYRLAQFSSQLSPGQASLQPTMIASIPLYGMHYHSSTLPSNIAPEHPIPQLCTPQVWSARFSLPPHLKRPSQNSFVTFSLAFSVSRSSHDPSESVSHALVTTTYTLPSTEEDLVAFLSQVAERDTGIWSLRPDADGYAVLLAYPPEYTWYSPQCTPALEKRPHGIVMSTETAVGSACPLPITELHRWFSVEGLTSYPQHLSLGLMRFLRIGRSLAPSQATLQMPVFCSPNVSHPSSTGRWSTEFSSAGPDELEHYEARAELRAAWSETAIPMATVNPWYVTLSMSRGNSELPCTIRGPIRLRGVGDGWLVYQWRRRHRLSPYQTVLVWFD